jgi:hypothetical protein
METSEIIKSSYYKKVLELIKSVLPVIIYPNEPESLAVKICKLPIAEGEQEKVSSNFMQARDLTDEEWLELPKEEILQLYKNCYNMLQNYIGLSGEKIEDVPSFTSTEYPEAPFYSESADNIKGEKRAIHLICRRCGNDQLIDREGYVYNKTHHLEQTYCLKCEKPIDEFHDVLCCDIKGNEIEEGEDNEQIDQRNKKCVAGCIAFAGRETYHHKDCMHYPYSMSRELDELKALLAAQSRPEKDKKIIEKQAELIEIRKSIIYYLQGVGKRDPETILQDYYKKEKRFLSELNNLQNKE